MPVHFRQSRRFSPRHPRGGVAPRATPRRVAPSALCLWALAGRLIFTSSTAKVVDDKHRFGYVDKSSPKGRKAAGRSGRFFTLWESTYFRRGCRIGYTGLTAMPDTTTKRFVSGPVMAITSPAFNVVKR